MRRTGLEHVANRAARRAAGVQVPRVGAVPEIRAKFCTNLPWVAFFSESLPTSCRWSGRASLTNFVLTWLWSLNLVRSNTYRPTSRLIRDARGQGCAEPRLLSFEKSREMRAEYSAFFCVCAKIDASSQKQIDAGLSSRLLIFSEVGSGISHSRKSGKLP